MTTFKVGEKIVSMDTVGNLVAGKEYEVLYSGPGSCSRDMVGVAACEPEWLASRFRLVPVKVEGIRTIEQVREDRRKEILDGIVRYHAAGLAVPKEWIEELSYRGL